MKSYWYIICVALLLSQTVHAETLLVVNNNDSGAGSLRQAIADAIDSDVVVFDGSLVGDTILLNSSILIDFDVDIQGLGADQLTLSGGGGTNMFLIQSDANVSISGLQFVDGSSTVGGAISVAGAGTALTLTGSQFLNNNAAANGGAIDNTSSTITIIDSTFSSANIAQLNGGAINNAGIGTLIIRNSTFSGNQSMFFDGGAITNIDGVLDIANSTVINNFASNIAGGIGNNSISTISNITNTIVAGNTTGTGSSLEFGNLGDIGDITSGGGNIIGVVQGVGEGNSLGVFNEPGDQFGTVASPLDPILGAIGANGGPTLTHIPLSGSPAIDQGVNIDLPDSDQRGQARLSNGTVDIGSVEIQAALEETFFSNGFEGL